MKRYILATAVFATMIIISCSKSSEDDYNQNPPPPPGGGGNNCDTTDVSYQNDVVPILQSNCYTCHGENTNSGSMGIILQGHANLAAKATSGTLVGVITHASGYPAMPKDAGKLPECDINKIRAWVNAGAPDN
jgi:cytochrome c553